MPSPRLTVHLTLPLSVPSSIFFFSFALTFSPVMSKAQPQPQRSSFILAWLIFFLKPPLPGSPHRPFSVSYPLLIDTSNIHAQTPRPLCQAVSLLFTSFLPLLHDAFRSTPYLIPLAKFTLDLLPSSTPPPPPSSRLVSLPSSYRNRIHHLPLERRLVLPSCCRRNRLRTHRHCRTAIFRSRASLLESFTATTTTTMTMTTTTTITAGAKGKEEGTGKVEGEL